MDFMNENGYSQLVISESAATCIANQVAKSNIGVIDINRRTFVDIHDGEDLNFTSTTLAPHLPIFEQKLGKNKPLKGRITAKDIKIMFSQFDADIILDYTLCFSASMDLLGA